MSAGQIAAVHGRIRVPIVIASLVGAFAVGGLAGFSLPRAASSSVDAAADTAAPVTVAGAVRSALPIVAVNNMSDAAYGALAADKRRRAFHLAKVCDTATHCVVTSSSFKAIPAGTEINYTGPDVDHLTAIIVVKNGSAIGRCAIGSIFGDPSVPGTCRFDRGTGRLTRFHLKVAVTFDGSNWYWDGTYWFGDGGRTR